MTQQPIKLTDEVLSTILDCHYYVGVVKVEDLVDAIRTLRDRAKAVVEDADRPLLKGESEPDVEIGKKLIDALREVLP